ncbi:aromatic hydrocarbon degradation protein [Bacterioplanes sanyensis]|uniref:Aromatic hydrocarbon degradation protein n=1 Tax=Bacterioplanes sanyensis TaxID=1249553 RepID=A0A222FMU8_9GAMM|nr:outer membrane protein transport protein [Bacterioplanes sanyensis]ASP39896.1 aromatic hydrocarbon degradation protein [Bacterioplanes sanyensis]
MKRAFPWRAALPLAIMAATLPAHGQLAQNLFLDTKAMSLGNAVTADPTGIMDIHFNPAGLTKLDGRQWQLQAMNVYLSATTRFALPDGYDPDESGLLPIHEDPVLQEGDGEASAAAYIPGYGIMPMNMLPILTLPTGGISIKPPGSKFTFANAVYAPMAAGFAKDDDDPGRYQAKQVALQRFTYLSPSFGYQVTDEFSVGASFLFSHQAVSVVQDIRAPSVLIGVLEELQDAFGCFDENGAPTGNDPLAPLVTLCGGDVGPYDDVGELRLSTEESLSPSFNVGLLWEPNDWFAFGLGYQSEAVSRLKGTYELEYTPEFADFFRSFRSSIIGAIGGAIFSLPTGVRKESGNVSVEMTYPQHLQLGTKFRFWDRYQLNVDAGWTDFEKWDSLKFEFDRQVSFLSTAKTLAPGLVTDTTLKQTLGYRSVWSWGFGFQYDLNSRIKLRLGYEPRETSIPKDARSAQAPLGFARLYSVGMGYQWDMDTVIDLSLSFMQSAESIKADPQEAEQAGDYPNSSNAINRNCLTCTVSNPYPGLDVDTELTIGSAGISFRTKF